MPQGGYPIPPAELVVGPFGGELSIHLAAIVFMVDPEIAVALVRKLFADLDREIRK